MASKNVEVEKGRDYEEQVASKVPCNIEKQEGISLKAEEYLNSDDVRFCADPKLKREREKLQDLLNSYKKLIGKLETKFSSEEEKKAEEKRLSKVPEIYAVLHPELYRDRREDEKIKLIEKFSKRQFSPVDRVIPPICRTPDININDRRQEEKERFIKILSSCPARFHNSVESPSITVKVRRPKYSVPLTCPKNDRDLEKERLCKILASSGTYYRKCLDKRPNPSLSQRSKQSSIEVSKINQKSPSKGIMVRPGEYSPLNVKGASNFLQGSGEHNERRAQLIAERRKEYQDHLDSSLRNGSQKADKCLSTDNFNQRNEPDGGIEEIEKRKRCNSISTQTESFFEGHNRNSTDEINNRNIEETNRNDIGENGVHSEYFESPQHKHRSSVNEIFYLSPRDKLMSDLHGVSNCFPGGSQKVSPRDEPQDLKLRKAAYAKALQEQIEEKRRLEEIKKLREKEEEEMIEQRIRLQQKKIETELNEEERRRHDWMAQRQSREEVLRRRMLELELEAQEIKKNEKKKKQDVAETLPEMKREIIGSRPLPPPQTTLSEPTPLLVRSFASDEKPRAFKFEGLREAPVLDADRQNILTSHDLALLRPSLEPPRTKAESSVSPVRKFEERERAEELLRAPLDFRIERPSSPPIPAIKTRGIINNNTKVLDTKWEIPKIGGELRRTEAGRDNILTQLGAFRRQLHQEHIKLEARLLKQQTP